MSSLFKDISGGRPEHVAKGALIYLLRREAGLVNWLASSCGRRVPEGTTMSVMAEVAEGEHGWRADIVIEWTGTGAPKPLALELKLGAPFTRNQREALDAGEVEVVIAPSANLANIPAGTRVLAWRDVLAQVSSSDVGAAAALLLLTEAAESYGWYLERISSADIDADARAMFDNEIVAGRTQRDWGQSYRFLSQIDSHLESSTPAGWRYLPGASNLVPNKKYAHYGYYFVFAPQKFKAPPDQWWIGFNREEGKLALRLYMNETEIRHEWSVGTELQASVVAREAIATIEQILSKQ